LQRGAGLSAAEKTSKRMLIWKDNLISRKNKITSSVENLPPEIMDWMDDIVR
jgi:hypothetical protein